MLQDAISESQLCHVTDENQKNLGTGLSHSELITWDTTDEGHTGSWVYSLTDALPRCNKTVDKPPILLANENAIGYQTLVIVDSWWIRHFFPFHFA